MKYFLSIVFTVLVLIACEKPSQPNIIIVLVDDMGYGDPQSYVASSKIPTPNIDALANEGIKFTDAHSPSSVCTPTRYGILTGRYAWRTRLKKAVLGPYNAPLIESERLTIPKMLKEKGYETAIIGKWHLGMQWGTKGNEKLPLFWDRNFDQSVIDHSKRITAGPLTAGFDYFFGVDVPNFPPYIFIEDDKLQGNPSIKKPKNMYGIPGMMLPGWKLEEILPTFTQKAVTYINNYASNKSGKPFYLHFSATSPHTPIVPAKEFIGKSKAGPYGDLVYQTDYALGEIRKALIKNGLLENTIIIFTSDNGSPARAGDPFVHGPDFQVPGSVYKKFGHNPNAPLRGMKADIWEGGHRVPFIVSWPGKITGNKVSDELISSIDIMASIASLVDYDLPKNAAEDSFDFSSLFFEKNVNTKKMENDSRKDLIHHSIDGSFAIRKGKWKMTPQSGAGGWGIGLEGKLKVDTPGQLYDLSIDPKESKNLWNEYPEIVEELNVLLEKYKTEDRSIELRK